MRRFVSPTTPFSLDSFERKHTSHGLARLNGRRSMLSILLSIVSVYLTLA